MTKLILKLGTSTTEQVDSSCIDDLYYLTKNNNISVENGSVIEGKINAPTSTIKKINVLHTLDESNNPVTTGNEGEWDNLFITASTYAIEFEDSEVERLLRVYITNRGWGSDLTSTNLAKITSIDRSLGFNSPSINTLNDLLYLTGCTYIESNTFTANKNATSIILPPNLITLKGLNVLRSITSVRIPSRVTGDVRSAACDKLQLLVIDGSIGTLTLGEDSGIYTNPLNIVIRGSVGAFASNFTPIATFWVPDVEEYKAKTGFSNYTSQIKAISEMPAELALRVSELQ